MTGFLTAVVVGLGAAVCAAEPPEAVVWHDAAALTIEGKGWSDTAEFYDRLPAKAQAAVPEPVWSLSRNSTGIAVRFITDARQIRARWALRSPGLAMSHMPATGVSGIDLYRKHDGKWRWLGVGQPAAQENESVLISNLEAREAECVLYLPLYNGVTRVEVGVPEGSTLRPAPVRRARPVVFYGTSITQGGCASRPGMAYPAIVGRRLDVPTVNLGFSGNGRCEHEVADLLAEIDAAVFVINPLPNMTADMVEDRISYLLTVIKNAHPRTPVVLVENIVYQQNYAVPGVPRDVKSNRELQKLYKNAAPQWDNRLHYVKSSRLLGSDGEATVDGTHPTDLGFVRIADALAPAVARALEQAAD